MSKSKVILVSGAIVVLGAIATSVLATSCDTVCTTEARASVVVRLVDESGDPIRADWVSYEIAADEPPRDGSANPGQTAECIDDDCTEWVAGYETEGLFLVTAQVCGRQLSGRVDVGMTDDGCHVDTRELVLEADTTQCERPRALDLSETRIGFPVPPTRLSFTAPEPEICSLEARPSVLVRVLEGTGSTSRPVTPSGVYYQLDRGPLLSALCLDEECTEWAAGWEEPGEFSLFAIRGNHLLRGRADVGLTDDGCHVATQFVDLFDDAEIAGVDLVDHGPTLTSKPRQCTYEARPSVILEIVDSESEVAHKVAAKSVWYEIEEIVETTRAMCREQPCDTWFVGIEQSGVFDIHADVCDQVFDTQVTVGHTTDGCHVVTEYAKLVVDMSACPR